MNILKKPQGTPEGNKQHWVTLAYKTHIFALTYFTACFILHIQTSFYPISSYIFFHTLHHLPIIIYLSFNTNAYCMPGIGLGEQWRYSEDLRVYLAKQRCKNNYLYFTGFMKVLPDCWPTMLDSRSFHKLAWSPHLPKLETHLSFKFKVKHFFPYEFYPNAVINFNSMFLFLHNTSQICSTKIFIFLYVEKIKQSYCI